MVINEIIAIVIGYLLGSIPSAYIVARIAKGKDIRQIGSGNIGGLNTYREVGAKAAGVVIIADISKGAAAVAIAYWLLAVPQLFVLLAGLAAVIGHMWMVWLKFSGGKSVGTAVGILSVLMPVYGWWQGLFIFFAIILVPLIITRNVAFSSLIALSFLPLITWLGTNSLLFTIFTIIIGVMIGWKHLPTAKADWARAETKRDFIFDRWRRDKR